MSLEVLHKANQLIRDNEINWGKTKLKIDILLILYLILN